jgi:hypothetical protein
MLRDESKWQLSIVFRHDSGDRRKSRMIRSRYINQGIYASLSLCSETNEAYIVPLGR